MRWCTNIDIYQVCARDFYWSNELALAIWHISLFWLVFDILPEFHFSTEECLWFYCAIIIFRPLEYTKYSLNRWLTHKVHHWATILPTIFLFIMCFGLSRITKSLALIRRSTPVYIFLDNSKFQIGCKGQNSCRFQYDLTLQLIVQLQTQCMM